MLLPNKKNSLNWIVTTALIILLTACSSSGKKTSDTMNKAGNIGTYGSDVDFFAKNKIKTIELKDGKSKACVLLVPAYQGRVLTSTVGGSEGASFL